VYDGDLNHVCPWLGAVKEGSQFRCGVMSSTAGFQRNKGIKEQLIPKIIS
jgi:hypothetical protein